MTMVLNGMGGGLSGWSIVEGNQNGAAPVVNTHISQRTDMVTGWEAMDKVTHAVKVPKLVSAKRFPMTSLTDGILIVWGGVGFHFFSAFVFGFKECRLHVYMDTSGEQAQHILAHLHHCNEEWFLRVQTVCHTEDFRREYWAVYGEGEGDAREVENCVYLYNSAKWFSRFLDDLKYKKFRGTSMEKVAEGIWKVSGSSIYPTMVDWFRVTFVPYVRSKLATYNEEEDEEPMDLLARLKSHATLVAVDMHKVIKRVFDEAQDCYTLVLQKPEKVAGVKDTYVLTYNELMAMLLSYDSYKLGPNFDRPVTGFKIWKEDHYYVNKTVFTENDILANLHVLGICQDKYLEFNMHELAYKDIRNGSLLLPNSMVAAVHQPKWKVDAKRQPRWEMDGLRQPREQFSEGTVTWVKAEDAISAYEKEGVVLLPNSMADGLRQPSWEVEAEDAICAYEKEGLGCELDLFDATIIREKWEGAPHDERLVGTANAHIPLRGPILPPCIAFEGVPSKEPSQKEKLYNLYVNVITKEMKLYACEYKLLRELKLVSDVKLHTEMAYAFLERVCANIEMDNLLEDVMEIGRVLDKMPVGLTRTETSGAIPGGGRDVLQKYHTKSYVEKHKDDTAELAATVAIRNVNSYLEGVMEKSKINSNRIGQDLVELGVKKVRRSRGFFYGLTDANASVNP